jgi:hypothetical protein
LNYIVIIITNFLIIFTITNAILFCLVPLLLLLLLLSLQLFKNFFNSKKGYKCELIVRRNTVHVNNLCGYILYESSQGDYKTLNLNSKDKKIITIYLNLLCKLKIRNAHKNRTIEKMLYEIINCISYNHERLFLFH